MSTNTTIAAIQAARSATKPEEKLTWAIKALLIALDSQFLDGKAPGSYWYSGNVTDAMNYARVLATPDPPTAPQPPLDDRASTVKKPARSSKRA